MGVIFQITKVGEFSMRVKVKVEVSQIRKGVLIDTKLRLAAVVSTRIVRLEAAMLFLKKY